MSKDDAPRKPPDNDSNQRTLDTRAPSAAQDSTFLESQPQPGTTKHSTFLPGDLIAKRFRIKRFIARGGMGEVYEALDIELKQRVALKTVRSVLLADVLALERFRQEIIVAKRVTHANVCRTYDLFRHESTKPGESDVLVVSMELLSGQTLDHFLRQKGKLSTEEALPLIQQMMAGLSAAHQAGVVHRDFKANNVLLVPPPTGGPARVVVTDFGLAHSLDSDEFSFGGSGEMLGTPAFMAPEQVTGKAITPATDIYALGVVMFEMLTGRLPFSGHNAREIAFKRLEEPAPSPKQFVPELDEQWSGAILKCLERQPADRFQNVGDLEYALVGEAEARLRAELAQRQRRRRSLLAAFSLLAVVTLGIVIGVAFPNYFHRHTSPSVAVLGFKNLTGDPSLDTWGNEFRMNLGNSLDVTQIRYMGPEAVQPAWKYENVREMPEEPNSEALAKLYNLGCRYVVFGTYTVTGTPPDRKILWTIRLVDAKTGESLGSLTKPVTESERIDVVTTAGAELRRKLGVSLSSAEKRSVDNTLPANEEASRDYTDGLIALENFQYLKAKDAFFSAVQADPNNAEIRSALAEAWRNLGYETKAREEAKRAADLAGSLAGEKNPLIRARYFAYSGQWDQAATLYASLWKLNPEKYSYALLLAESQTAGKHYSEALGTLQKIEKSNPSSPIARAKVQLALAEVQQHLGDNGARLQAAISAGNIAASADAGLLQARAEIVKCQALFDIGKVADASQACANAVELNKQIGDNLGTARAQNSVANLYYNHGDLDKAQPLYESALSLAARIGDKRDQAGALLNLGNIQRLKGNFAEAKKLYEQSIQISEERTGINDDLLGAKQGLALVLGATGKLRDEARMLQEVIQDARSIGDKPNLSAALLNLCTVLLPAGDVPGAKAACEESLQLLTETGDKTGQAMAQQYLGDVLTAADDLYAAESHYQLALKLQQERGAPSDIAYAQASLADLSVSRRDFTAAENFAQSALQTFLSQNDSAGEVSARCTLAQAYLGMHRPKDAEQQITKAREHLHDLQDPSALAAFSIQRAIVQNSSKTSPVAISELKKIESEMRAADQLQLALEAKLARLETLTGSARKLELKSFADEAKQHGYLLLARKASS